jgi:hypothetical protein
MAGQRASAGLTEIRLLFCHHRLAEGARPHLLAGQHKVASHGRGREPSAHGHGFPVAFQGLGCQAVAVQLLAGGGVDIRGRVDLGTAALPPLPARVGNGAVTSGANAS